MASWGEISGDPDYQALPESEKRKVADGFYSNAIGKDPDFISLPEVERNKVQSQFYMKAGFPPQEQQGYRFDPSLTRGVQKFQEPMEIPFLSKSIEATADLVKRGAQKGQEGLAGLGARFRAIEPVTTALQGPLEAVKGAANVGKVFARPAPFDIALDVATLGGSLATRMGAVARKAGMSADEVAQVVNRAKLVEMAPPHIKTQQAAQLEAELAERLKAGMETKIPVQRKAPPQVLPQPPRQVQPPIPKPDEWLGAEKARAAGMRIPAQKPPATPKPQPFTIGGAIPEADQAAMQALKKELPPAPVSQRAGTSAYKGIQEPSIDLAITPTKPADVATKVVAFQSFKDKVSNAWLATKEFVADDWQRVKKLVYNPKVKITEASDPYQAEILFHGRAATRVAEARATVSDIDKSVLNLSKTSGVPDKQIIKDVDDFLIARHAPERNAALGEKAAGITTEEAKAAIARIQSSPHGKEVARIADRFQELNNKTLDVLLDGEVIDRGLYDTLRNKYKHHVPLNRVFEDTDDIAGAIAGRPFSVKGTGVLRAKGSEREVSDMAANITSNYEQAVLRAEKNRVNLATLKFARDNPQLGLFREMKPKAIGKTFEGNILRENVTDPTILIMREKGKPIFLKIEDPNLAVALRGVNRMKVDGVMRVIGAFSRFYSGLSTRFNPEFAFPNKIRDLQEAVVYAASKGELGFAGAAKAAKSDPKSMKSIVDHIRGVDSEGAKLYQQMKMDGGTTGGLGLSTRKMVELDIQAIRELNRSNPKKAVESIVNGIDNWNTIFEDSTRLSVYAEALARGVSRGRAAVLAKEASINFNKFGRGGPVINALYMFSNASIQGSAKMLRAMKNPKVAGAVVSAVTTAVAGTNEWNDKIDPEWRDKVSPWDRMNSLPIMYPTGDGGVTYFVVPVSWGMKPIKVAADYALDGMEGRGKGVSDSMSGTLAAIMEGYNPIGGTDLISAVTPTILDMPVDIARNKSWMGSKIRPDWDKNAPPSIQYFDSLRDSASGRTFVAATKGLSGAGIEISPAYIKYGYEQVIGGAGRFGSKIIDTIAAAGEGELPPVKETPFASRFVRTKTEEQMGGVGQDFEDIKKRLREQSRERFYLNQQAEDSYNQLKKIDPSKANQMFSQIKKEDPKLAEKITDIAQEDRMGLNYTDRLVKSLGVDNGERAKFFAKKLNDMKTVEQKRAYVDEMEKKKLVSKKVMDQLRLLLKGGGTE